MAIELQLTLLGLIVGLIGLFVTVLLSIRSNTALKKETAHLTFLLELILKSLQNEGLADLNQDEDGHVTGLNVSIQAKTAILKLLGHPPTAILTDADNRK